LIIGIGTDLCDIRRIESTIGKFGERFIERIFTKKERAYCDSKSARASAYAKRFAAKEAAAKALSGPKTGHLRWRDVEVTNDISGRPVITVHKQAAERLESLTPSGMSAHIHLSLTDDYPYAQAFVICEVRPINANSKRLIHG